MNLIQYILLQIPEGNHTHGPEVANTLPEGVKAFLIFVVILSVLLLLFGPRRKKASTSNNFSQQKGPQTSPTTQKITLPPNLDKISTDDLTAKFKRALDTKDYKAMKELFHSIENHPGTDKNQLKGIYNNILQALAKHPSLKPLAAKSGEAYFKKARGRNLTLEDKMEILTDIVVHT